MLTKYCTLGAPSSLNGTHLSTRAPLFPTLDGPLSFGRINFYFFYNNQPLTLIHKFTVMEDGILDDVDSPTLMRANKILDRFFIKVKKLSLTNEISTGELPL